jgi:hypothetical protein
MTTKTISGASPRTGMPTGPEKTGSPSSPLGAPPPPGVWDGSKAHVVAEAGDAAALAHPKADPALAGAAGKTSMAASELIRAGVRAQYPVLDEDQIDGLLMFREMGLPDMVSDFVLTHRPPPELKIDLKKYWLLLMGGVLPQVIEEHGSHDKPPLDLLLKEAGALQVESRDPYVRQFMQACYCALRLRGHTEHEAKHWAPAGRLFVEFVTDGGRSKIDALYIGEAGFLPSPASYMRVWEKSLEPSELLGKGGFNEVFRVKLVDPVTCEDKYYAFKPSQREAKPGLGGTLTGIDDDSYMPDLRNMAAVGIARVLNLAGPGGVTGDAFMGLIDDKLGLVMELAPGHPTAEHFYEKKVRTGSILYKRLRKFRKQLQNPTENRLQSMLLGVHSIRFKVLAGGGVRILLTGTAEHRNYPDQLGPYQAQDPSLKKSYALMQLFVYLVNDSDGHPMNTFVQKDAKGIYTAQRIDLDQCLGHLSPEDSLALPTNAGDGWMKYYLAMFPTHITPELRTILLDAKTPKELIKVLYDLEIPGKPDKKYLADSSVLPDFDVNDDDEYKAPDAYSGLIERLDRIKAAIVSGDIKTVHTDEDWRAEDMSDPQRFLFGRDSLRMTDSLLGSL